MFKDEEEKLEKWKEEIEKVGVLETELEGAIRQGLQRAQHAKRVKKRPVVKRGVWTAVVAVILLLALVTSVRVSTTFAGAVASLPGMEGLVELIRYDKGIAAAIDNDDFQRLHLSAEKDGVTLTLEGVIADEKEMVLFYTVKGEKSDEILFMNGTPELINNNGKNVAVDVLAGVTLDERKSTERAAYQSVRIDNAIDETMFTLKAKMESKFRSIDYEIPFSLEKKRKPAEKYPIHQTVVIEGQEITFQYVEMATLRVGIHFQINPSNTKEILSFDDFKLVDNKGKKWTSINENGIGYGIRSEGENQVMYLPINYFNQPKELYMEFTKLQALDKDETHVLVDMDKQIILEQPSDGRFKEVGIMGNHLRFLFESGTELHTSVFSGEVEIVESGEIIDPVTNGMRVLDERHLETSVELPPGTIKGVMKLDIASYPQWIREDVRIRIK
ncbi:DUF4179 domain-containing protein [Sporosarcina sp. FSL K6-2383]|uniref:DUF4179 domain-containing protein n=1 Tax=Sporosarcina sp. FSL K6-2383 TaxID=2921556 RepID=UPI00315A51EF